MLINVKYDIDISVPKNYIIDITDKNNITWSIRKRYKDIYLLHKHLKPLIKEYCPDVIFPRRKLFGSYSLETIKERALIFDTYFYNLSLYESIINNIKFIEFIRNDICMESLSKVKENDELELLKSLNLTNNINLNDIKYKLGENIKKVCLLKDELCELEKVVSVNINDCEEIDLFIQTYIQNTKNKCLEYGQLKGKINDISLYYTNLLQNNFDLESIKNYQENRVCSVQKDYNIILNDFQEIKYMISLLSDKDLINLNDINKINGIIDKLETLKSFDRRV